MGQMYMTLFFPSICKVGQRHQDLLANAFAVNLNLDALKEAYPWGQLKGAVVDVGGGSGKVSITLAQVP